MTYVCNGISNYVKPIGMCTSMLILTLVMFVIIGLVLAAFLGSLL